MNYKQKTSHSIKEDYTRNLLIDRGILTDLNNTDWYFNPGKDNWCDPSLLDNIEEGYQLFLKHCQNGSKIRFYVDCDTDGFTSSALLINYFNEFLKPLYPDVEISYHIPEAKEHGLQTVMRELTNQQICDLIILPDSSSNDFREHKELKDMGYDILVLDHHKADKYSENAVVINNQLSQNYPNKDLSGVGVVYKFLQYFEMKQDNKDFSSKFNVEKFIDLVALGEISDMMLMQNAENRLICDKGLKSINNSLFKEIIKKQCYSIFGIDANEWVDDYLDNGDLTQIKIAFYVTPLINALIRVGSQRDKELLFESFLNGDKVVKSTKRGAAPDATETIAEQSVRNCINAQAKQNREKEKAIKLLDIQISNDCLDDNKILILNVDDLDVPNTLTGLIAMGIAAKYKKPTILGRTCNDGTLKGSMRGRGETQLKDFRQFLLDSKLMNYVEG